MSKYLVELIPVGEEGQSYKGEWSITTAHDAAPHLINFYFNGAGHVAFYNAPPFYVQDHAKSSTVSLLYFNGALLVTMQMPLENVDSHNLHYENVSLTFSQNGEIGGHISMVILGRGQQLYNVQGKLNA